MLQSKGQLFTTDLIFAIVFLAFLLSIYAIANKQVEQNLSLRYEQESISKATRDAALVLLSPGMPKNWSANNVHTIGLTAQKNVLSKEKIERFLFLANKDYEKARQLLGLYREGISYDFALSISTLEGEELYSFSPQELGDTRMAINRYALLENEPVLLRIEVGKR
jgi:hypothetical protein